MQINVISHKLNYNLSFTGFLNGACLAEYCNFFSLHLAENEQTKAILFNSPGIEPIEESNLCVNDLTEPNFYNCYHKHTGEMYRMFIETQASDEYVNSFKKLPKYGLVVYAH